jgi:hypothetical protein
VSVEAFNFAELPDEFDAFAERLTIILDDAGPALKLIDR